MTHLMPGTNVTKDTMLQKMRADSADIDLLRPSLTEMQKRKAVRAAQQAYRGKPNLVYRDIDNAALVPGELVKNLGHNRDSLVANEVSKFFGGFFRPNNKKCLGGNCAWFPGFAFNPKNPDKGAETLGIKPTHGFYSPADYMHAADKGVLERIYKYTMPDIDFEDQGLRKRILGKILR